MTFFATIIVRNARGDIIDTIEIDEGSPMSAERLVEIMRTRLSNGASAEIIKSAEVLQ